MKIQGNNEELNALKNIKSLNVKYYYINH